MTRTTFIAGLRRIAETADQTEAEALNEAADLIEMMTGKSPFCPHPSAYLHTDDGGKTMVCLKCELDRRSQSMLPPAKAAEIADVLVEGVISNHGEEVFIDRGYAAGDELRKGIAAIIHAASAEVEAHRSKARGEYWVWQGDGEDHLESLTCPVLIDPNTLRQLLQAQA